MVAGPFVLRDLSACCYVDRGAGAPGRLRAMRVLIALEDPDKHGGIRRLAGHPQSLAGCLVAALCGL